MSVYIKFYILSTYCLYCVFLTNDHCGKSNGGQIVKCGVHMSMSVLCPVALLGQVKRLTECGFYMSMGVLSKDALLKPSEPVDGVSNVVFKRSMVSYEFALLGQVKRATVCQIFF